ncbi:MAG: hypothetical protein K8R92_05135 [Planctomycetes bacterium]|nr:hypothetical protein [Planctomycetota bacterium]
MNPKSTFRFPRTIVAPIAAAMVLTAALAAAQNTPPTQPATPQTKPAPAPATPAGAQPPASAQPGIRSVQGAQASPQVRPSGRPAPMPPQQSVPVPAGGDPRNTDRSIPTSQLQQDPNGNENTWSTPGTALPNQSSIPRGAGYNNPGGMVNPDALQSEAMNHVHYHYHYENGGGFVGNVQPGYAQAQYVNPDDMNQAVNPMNVRTSTPGGGVDGAGGGGMYVNNTNARVGNNGAGVPVTWNPFMGDGSGMLTYGAGSVEGFND